MGDIQVTSGVQNRQPAGINITAVVAESAVPRYAESTYAQPAEAGKPLSTLKSGAVTSPLFPQGLTEEKFKKITEGLPQTLVDEAKRRFEGLVASGRSVDEAADTLTIWALDTRVAREMELEYKKKIADVEIITRGLPDSYKEAIGDELDLANKVNKYRKREILKEENLLSNFGAFLPAQDRERSLRYLLKYITEMLERDVQESEIINDSASWLTCDDLERMVSEKLLDQSDRDTYFATCHYGIWNKRVQLWPEDEIVRNIKMNIEDANKERTKEKNNMSIQEMKTMLSGLGIDDTWLFRLTFRFMTNNNYYESGTMEKQLKEVWLPLFKNGNTMADDISESPDSSEFLALVKGLKEDEIIKCFEKYNEEKSIQALRDYLKPVAKDDIDKMSGGNELKRRILTQNVELYRGAGFLGGRIRRFMKMTAERLDETKKNLERLRPDEQAILNKRDDLIMDLSSRAADWANYSKIREARHKEMGPQDILRETIQWERDLVATDTKGNKKPLTTMTFRLNKDSQKTEAANKVWLELSQKLGKEQYSEAVNALVNDDAAKYAKDEGLEELNALMQMLSADASKATAQDLGQVEIFLTAKDCKELLATVAYYKSFGFKNEEIRQVLQALRAEA